jgi:hypothetical protein
MREQRPRLEKPRELCKYWKTATGCFNGPECRFRHDDPVFSPRDLGKVCFFFQKGKCPRSARIRCLDSQFQVTANTARTVGTNTKRSLPRRSTSVSSATTRPRSSDYLVCDTRHYIRVSDANWPQRNATMPSATSARRSGGGRRARVRSARLAPSVEHLSA